MPNCKSFLVTEAERKHVRRHARFQHVDASCQDFFFSPARQGAVGNSRHCDRNLNTNSTTKDLFFLLRNKRYAKRFTPQSHLVKLKQIVTVLQNSHTVKPRFTNSSDHEQFGLRTNFPNTKRLR